MTQFDLHEVFKGDYRSLRSEFEKGRLEYGQTQAKGDNAEGLLRSSLLPYVPDVFRLERASIVDAHGRRTPVFDVVLVRVSNSLKLFAQAIERHSKTTNVPIENAIVALEVKSKLEEQHITKFDENLASVNAMRRYFRPTSLYAYTTRLARASGQNSEDEFSGKPLAGNQSRRNVGRILGTIVAFESPKLETVEGWLPEQPKSTLYPDNHFG
jgi:hypothetical protein